MAKKKDLSGAINRGADLFFSAHDEVDAQDAQDAQQVQQAQEPRKVQEVSSDELAATLQQMQSFIEAKEAQRAQARKVARMNIAFTLDNMAYLKTMGALQGMTVTRFVNSIIEQHAEANAERYNKIKEVIGHE